MFSSDEAGHTNILTEPVVIGNDGTRYVYGTSLFDNFNSDKLIKAFPLSQYETNGNQVIVELDPTIFGNDRQFINDRTRIKPFYSLIPTPLSPQGNCSAYTGSVLNEGLKRQGLPPVNWGGEPSALMLELTIKGYNKNLSINSDYSQQGNHYLWISSYEVSPELAGETVVLWWGVFDSVLYVEHNENRFGPFAPTGGPIPLHRYRSRRKTAYERCAERVEKLADKLELSRTALFGGAGQPEEPASSRSVLPFVDPDPFQEFAFSNTVMAKHAVADYLGIPLARLSVKEINDLNEVLEKTMNKREIMAWVRQHLRPAARR